MRNRPFRTRMLTFDLSGDDSNPAAQQLHKFQDRDGDQIHIFPISRFSRPANDAISALSGGPMQDPWFAAYTLPRHKKQVAMQLRGTPNPVFLPSYRSARRWKDRRKVLDRSPFPSYLFVQIRPDNRLDLLRLPGVLGLVCFQSKPAPVASTEIENLRQGLASHTRVHPYLKAGRKLRIRSGPMAGVDGILVRKCDCARVVLSISLRQRSISLDIDEAGVQPIN